MGSGRSKRFFSIEIPSSAILLLKGLITIAAGGICVYFFLKMLQKESKASVISNGVFLLFGLYWFGILCASFYTGYAANGLVDFLLFPRRFLKKPPVILSRQQGLIASGHPEQAELELINLRAQHPDSPEITLMLAELHAEEGNFAAATADCQFYFAHRRLRYHELNLPIVLRYADWEVKRENHKTACRQLEQELRSSLYPPVDKKSLELRLNSLREQLSEK